MSSDSNSSGELELRLRQACAELERRLRGGETQVAEKLLAEDPRIAAEEDLAIELIYTEFVTLEELGNHPSPHEMLDRFPKFRGRLERLLEVHDALGGDADIDLTRSSETLGGIDSTRDGTAARSGPTEAPGGRRIGRYELLDEIDRGGTGIVYRARQEGLNRIVAVKVIRSADASESERSRFRAEAESAAKLQHPNIVQVYDVGEQDSCEFLSMEYIEGGSLQRRLERERLSVHDAAQLTATLAEAIHIAHQRGIVHRDLKPGNILLAENVPKIGDFGLAKRMIAGSGAQTQSGALLGTPCYMSPEQAEGKTRDVGPATDVYALGAILYELLTGRPPFLGDTPLETMDLIRTKEPERPSASAPKVPRDLETICLKCLSKEAIRRYDSAQDLADDLKRFLDHRPIHARRVSPFERGWRWARRRPAISGLAATLVIVTLVGGLVVARQQRHVGQLSKSAEDTKREAAEVAERAEAATAEADDNLREAKRAIERLSSLGKTLHDQPGMGETARRVVEQVLDQYRILLEKHGDDEDVRREAARGFDRAGFIQDELGQFSAAEETLQRGTELYDTLQRTAEIDFERSAIRATLGHNRRHLRKWEEAEASYRAAIAILEELAAEYPANHAYALKLANTLVNISVVFSRDGRLESAQEAYCRAIRLQMAVIERAAGFDAARVVHASDESEDEIAGRTVTAVESLRHRLDLAPHTLADLFRRGVLAELAICVDDLGVLLQERGRTNLADTALRAALELRLLIDGLAEEVDRNRYFLARSYRNVGHLELYGRDYQKAAAAYEESVRILEELTAAFPRRAPYRIDLGASYAGLAGAQRRLDRLKDAMASHRKAIETHERLLAEAPTLLSSREHLAGSVFSMGRALLACGRRGDALAQFERAVDLDPDSARTANELAWMLLMDPDLSLRDPSRALPLARRAVELAPRAGNYWNTLGVAHYRSGDDDEAITVLMRSIELRQGGDGLDWFFLAMAHARRGEEELAAEWFERARVWCLTQDPLSDELQRTQAEASRAMDTLGADAIVEPR